MQILTMTMNPSIDKSSAVDRVVADRKLRCREPSFEPGGGGINVSRVIKILAGESTALYPAGGASGDHIQKLLNDRDITQKVIRIEGWTRENLMVIEESDGRQYRFGMPGPALSREEWTRCLESLFEFEAQPEYLVASGSLPAGVPESFYADIARRCRENNTRLVVDTSGEALRHAVREGVFLIKPNMRELRMLARGDIESEGEQEDFVRSIIGKGQSRYVVVSLGAGGVLAASGDSLERLRAPSVRIVSKVGAGDSTVAGIVLGLSQGKPFREAVKLGMAAGSAAVMTSGSQLCRREDVFNLYDCLSETPRAPRA